MELIKNFIYMKQIFYKLMFFYDIPNLLAIIIVVSVSFRIGLIPLWLSFFLILFSFTPFFS